MSLYHTEVSPVLEGRLDASMIHLGKDLDSLDTMEGAVRGSDATDDSRRSPQRHAPCRDAILGSKNLDNR